jgi:hypothetical protein
MADKQNIVVPSFHGAIERLVGGGFKPFFGRFFGWPGGAVLGGFPVRGAEKGQKGPERAFLGKMGCFQGFWRVLGWFADSFFTKYSQSAAFFGEKTAPDSQRTACAGERTWGISLRTASAGEGAWGISLRLARFGVGTADISLRAAGFGESSTALGERTARVGGGARTFLSAAMSELSNP